MDLEVTNVRLDNICLASVVMETGSANVGLATAKHQKRILSW